MKKPKQKTATIYNFTDRTIKPNAKEYSVLPSGQIIRSTPKKNSGRGALRRAGTRSSRIIAASKGPAV